MTDGGKSNADVAKRLIALRTALGHNQAAFAQLIGVSQPAINNYERGLRRPDIDVAFNICIRTGITLDWLYLGVRAGLPARLFELLPDLSDDSKQTG